jgi:carbon storage regulator
MLVLSRLKGEEIIITVPGGQQIRVVLVEIRGNKVRLGFEGPREFIIHRAEVQRAIDYEALNNQ